MNVKNASDAELLQLLLEIERELFFRACERSIARNSQQKDNANAIVKENKH